MQSHLCGLATWHGHCTQVSSDSSDLDDELHHHNGGGEEEEDPCAKIARQSAADLAMTGVAAGGGGGGQPSGETLTADNVDLVGDMLMMNL